MNEGTQLNILNFAVLAYDCGNQEFFNDMIEWLIKERSPLVKVAPESFLAKKSWKNGRPR